MAYVPPHKRKGNEARSLTPEMQKPTLQKNVNMGSLGLRDNAGTSRVAYANNAVKGWFGVGWHGQEMGLRPTFILQRVPMDRVALTTGSKAFMLVDNDGVGAGDDNKSWSYIADRVLEDLVSSSESLKTEIEGRNQKSEEVTPKLVARLGRVLFLMNRPSLSEEDDGKISTTATSLMDLWRTFCTNVPASFMKTVTDEIAPKIGFVFKDLKEVYRVKLSDKCRPGETISCRCRVGKDGRRLDIYKIELRQTRHMVYEISCLTKSFDVRLMLSNKRILTSLVDDDEESIRRLIDLAVLDSDVKGGLRWPAGKASSSAGRYRVTGVLHTVSRAYTSPSMRLKVQDADWIGFGTSASEVLGEVILKFKDIPTKLLEKNISSDSIFKMLEDGLKLLSENFLQFD